MISFPPPLLAVSIFNPLDLSIMFCYFAAVIWVGIHFSKKMKTTENYFLGGHNIPSWALGMSMLAAKISSVTFLALPAAAFALDWRLFVPYLTYPIVGLIAIWVFIPFYRNSAKTTAFQYLHVRFGKGARLYSSIMFLVAQVIRTGSILYLLSVPVQMMAGIAPVWTILAIGGFVALYTILGGLEAVVWTDVIQAVILYVGGAAALLIVIHQIPGGLPQIVQVALTENKFSLGPNQWDPSQRTVWTMLIVGISSCLYAYTADQNVVQRYLAAKSLKEAQKATLVSAVMCLPTWGFFFFVGTSLFVFYRLIPDPAVSGMPADNVFPHFILTQMPPGLTGVVIAGILSASMGSLSASLNSFATVSTADIIAPYLFKGRSDLFYRRTAQLMTGLGSVIMLFVACAFTYATKESFVDLSHKIAGLVGGVTLAFFLLGFFAPRVNRRIIWQSFWVSFLLNIYLVAVEMLWIPNILNIHIHPYWVSFFVIVFMIVLAIFLTLFTTRSAPKETASATADANRTSD